MRFAVEKEEKQFFDHHKHIEFADFFSPDEIADAQKEIEAFLLTKLGKLPETHDPKQIYRHGRGLWKKYPKLSLNRKLAEVAASLFQQKFLRLAFDQVIQSTTASSSLFPTSLKIGQISCIQPLVGAALIRLTSEESPAPLTPQKPGGVVFIHPDLIFPWSALTAAPHQTFLLLTFGAQTLSYLLVKEDPLTHDLKKEGYVFGDLVRSETCPTIFK